MVCQGNAGIGDRSRRQSSLIQCVRPGPGPGQGQLGSLQQVPRSPLPTLSLEINY